ncbi:DUF3152 domain-containing protein [Streptomyces marincola]|uniref:DUF3152 domain-containing protein n=1 Tax=Streptomyces marincola TaxID=2878388 RepID=UPI001CF290F4|nr:DUF3152 domain-containing protein [Streptomyces marincola]UCM90195.1 DUF3152 domain-containing protein [Streptomyces marincola]
MNHRDAPVPPHAGPRQEYVDAFDALDTDGNEQQQRQQEQQAERRIPGQRSAEQEEQAPGGRRRGPGRHGMPGDSRRHRRRKGGWGRTLTGIAAAAVVTALGVAVAVRVAGPDAGGADLADAVQPGPGGASEPLAEQDGPAPPPAEPSMPPEPAYEELLATEFELDPGLTGSGELVPVPGTAEAANPGATTELRYRVDVEDRIGLDPELFAEAVHRTLNDDRGWGNGDERSFTRVSAGDHDFVVTLASPGTTADWCARAGLDTTVDNVSCNASTTERVMINAWRWAQGAETFGDDIAGYRQMLINHEVGHRLGYGHVTCPAEGALAPVMMQQTKFLTMNGLTCRPNPWPHPDN